MAAERNAQTLTGEYWIPSQMVLAASVITKHLPRLLCLPTVLVKFCAEKALTGEDLFNEVGRLIGEQTTTPGYAELALHWCLAAMQLEPNKTSQGLVAFDMTGAMCSDQTFQSWPYNCAQKAPAPKKSGPLKPMFSAQKLVFGSLLKGYKESRIFEIALLSLDPLRRDPNWNTVIFNQWKRYI